MASSWRLLALPERRTGRALEPVERLSLSEDEAVGQIDPVPGCPGLVIDLDALWSELARLADE